MLPARSVNNCSQDVEERNGTRQSALQGHHSIDRGPVEFNGLSENARPERGHSVGQCSVSASRRGRKNQGRRWRPSFIIPRGINLSAAKLCVRRVHPQPLFRFGQNITDSFPPGPRDTLANAIDQPGRRQYALSGSYITFFPLELSTSVVCPVTSASLQDFCGALASLPVLFETGGRDGDPKAEAMPRERRYSYSGISVKHAG